MSTKALIDQFEGKRILIAGDVILDEYIIGDVNRISPEAPVPVVEIKKRIYQPGGAANTAANVAALGGNARLCGVVGNDPQGALFRTEIKKHNISGEGIFTDESRPTTIKTRIIAHDQQITRVDGEKTHDLSTELMQNVMQWLDEELNHISVCILSDYLKGMLSNALTPAIIQKANERNIPVVIDPKGKDFTKYTGAALIKPNKFELEQATNRRIETEDDLIEAGHELQSLLNGTTLLVTRGSKGMTLFHNQNPPVHIPSYTRTVYDVTGAGDTVISVIALATACGAPLETAARLANLAAGIVVGKLGTATLTVDEIMQVAKE